MSRLYTEYSNDHIKQLLESLADQELPPELYREAMISIGVELGKTISASFPGKSFYIVSTTEDADFLAKGLLTNLIGNGSSVSFSCFWNSRVTYDSLDDYALKTAPSIRKYIEPDFDRDVLVILKSIISSGCVVKYNILSITSKINPEKIAIISPVLMKGSDTELRNEFPQFISDKFSFFNFAIDDEKADGNVIPGIGGNVYKRLGFIGQEDKNHYTPTIVKERRHSFA